MKKNLKAIVSILLIIVLVAGGYVANMFGVLNKGNYGYDGTNKMINRIKNMDDTYFIIDMNNYYYGRIDSWSQHDCELIDYIMENGECVEKVGDLYKVYYIR